MWAVLAIRDLIEPVAPPALITAHLDLQSDWTVTGIISAVRRDVGHVVRPWAGETRDKKQSGSNRITRWSKTTWTHRPAFCRVATSKATGKRDLSVGGSQAWR